MDTVTILLRLALAVVLSGLIGQERENKNRPAGFRTHILVCVGATMVMLTSIYMFDKYRGIVNLDPARLGAQVISGIGFLGAGTIIREGGSVKGLTTAASLWSVACIGLAVGMGFYEGAIIGTVMIYLTLLVLGRFGKAIESKASHLEIVIDLDNIPGKIGEIGTFLGKHNVNIRNIEFLNEEGLEENEIMIKIALKLPHGISHEQLLDDLRKLTGIRSVHKI